jgi:hypothetical protein
MLGALNLGLSIAGGIGKTITGFMGMGARKKEQQRANAELAKRKAAFENLTPTNPYADLQNTMEDLTINQQQVDYETQQTAVNQANTMQALQGAAGGSGIAGLAQQMMNQGQQAAQKTAAGIGQQERANQMAAAQQAASIQSQKAQGDQWVFSQQQKKAEDLLSMAQGRKAAADEARSTAATQQMSGIADIAGGVGNWGKGNLEQGLNFFGLPKK